MSTDSSTPNPLAVAQRRAARPELKVVVRHITRRPEVGPCSKNAYLSEVVAASAAQFHLLSYPKCGGIAIYECQRTDGSGNRVCDEGTWHWGHVDRYAGSRCRSDQDDAGIASPLPKKAIKAAFERLDRQERPRTNPTAQPTFVARRSRRTERRSWCGVQSVPWCCRWEFRRRLA